MSAGLRRALQSHHCHGVPSLSPLRFFFSALIALALMLQVFGQETGTRVSDRLRITFHPADTAFADRVTGLVAATRPRLTALLGVEPVDTVLIHVAPSLEEFRTYTDRAIPDWSDGYAVPDLNLIVLQSPRVSGSLDRLQEVTAHELAHITLHNVLRTASIPRWLDEGFAQYAAREWGLWDRTRLIAMVLTDRLVPLSAINAVNTFPNWKAELTYQESALTIQYILDRYGYRGLHDLLDRLRLTGSINEACLDAFGVSIGQFEQDWLAYMQKTYGWRALPGDGLSLLAGPLLAILCLFAYFGMHRRRRNTLHEWDQEERAAYGWSPDEDRWRRFRQRFTVIRGGRKRDEDGDQ